MGSNVIKLVTEEAKKFSDNVAVQKLVAKLELAQLTVDANSRGDTLPNPLYAYELGSKGEDGYGLLMNPTSDFISNLMKQSYLLHEVAIVADCLASVLIGLGSDMQY
jgi:hypothetical protein